MFVMAHWSPVTDTRISGTLVLMTDMLLIEMPQFVVVMVMVLPLRLSRTLQSKPSLLRSFHLSQPSNSSVLFT